MVKAKPANLIIYLIHFFSPTKSVTGHSQHEQVLAFFCQGNSAHTRGSSMKSSHNHLNMLTLKIDDQKMGRE